MIQNFTISLSSPDISEKEIQVITSLLKTPYLSTGPYLIEFEKRFSQFTGTKNAIGVSSGTAGLHSSIIAAGIKEGDEVITTPYSFVSSSNCILYERAKPVFVDIDPITFNIDPLKIQESITKKTKAILPVHVFGYPCNMDSIMTLAREAELTVIEDACESIGAEWKGKKTGTFGSYGVFAFYPNKQMTTGEGGMIITDNDEGAALIRSVINQGRNSEGTWLHHVRLGYNYRLDEMSAALGSVQISRIEELLAKRSIIAEKYKESLQKIDGISLPYESKDAKRSWFVYVIQFDQDIDRNMVMKHLQEKNIPSRPYFTPIHTQPFYKEKFGFKEGDFPITEAISKKTLALPFHNFLSDPQITYIADSLRESIEISG